MRRLTAFSTAVLLPVTLVTAPALPVLAASSPTARAAATQDVPTYTPGVAGWPSGKGFDVAYRASTTNVLYRRLDEEHRALWPRIDRLPVLADTIATSGDRERDAALDALTGFLTDLAEHERKDESLLYPAVAQALGGADPTGAMSRGHTEIAELTRRIGALIAELRAAPAAPEPVRDLRRIVQELYAVLRLHFAQEEENYFVLADVHDTAKP
jgi:iron-sulfur cluster repair protein YtfE (RIC family)